MKKEQILKKAIEKAVKNGMPDIFGPHPRPTICKAKNGVYINELVYAIPEVIIFSHDFAKAFWKSEMKVFIFRCKKHPEHYYYTHKYCSHCGELLIKELREDDDWIDHLQQMVLEKDPIKYLEKFV